MIVPLLLRCAQFAASINTRQCGRIIHTQNNLQASQNNLRKTIQKHEEVKKIRSYLLTRYMQYVQNYEKVIEKKFPTAMHLYRTFKVGMKEFYRDFVSYVKVVRILNTTTDGMKCLTLNQIVIYYKMRKDIKKVAPVLLLSALPLSNYVVFPLALFYPRQTLCSHFWTLQQRSEFQIHYLRVRLMCQRPTFRCLQSKLDSLKGHQLYDMWSEILGLIGSGVQPTTDQIIHCKELFEGELYGLGHLKGRHLKNLLKMHALHVLWFRRARLREHAKLLRAMDRAMVREGGVSVLSHDTLRYACFLRGLNPTNMRNEDLMVWLQQWLKVSDHVDAENLSLILHLPILLGYNQPSNWLLIY